MRRNGFTVAPLFTRGSVNRASGAAFCGRLE